ncbi:MAG: transposase zinc-binding domain-containing protein [Rhodocyclaceae bacterium]|nr:transposase zinc-binding domain-containing protein [Rhodocyclaceae bacterium]
MADIVRAAGAAYCAGHHLAGVQRRALADITACRTAAAGATHLRCGSCGADFVRYHSCGNRHCPKCQTLAKERWLAARNVSITLRHFGWEVREDPVKWLKGPSVG